MESQIESQVQNTRVKRFYQIVKRLDDGTIEPYGDKVYNTYHSAEHNLGHLGYGYVIESLTKEIPNPLNLARSKVRAGNKGKVKKGKCHVKPRR